MASTPDHSPQIPIVATYEGIVQQTSMYVEKNAQSERSSPPHETNRSSSPWDIDDLIRESGMFSYGTHYTRL